MDDSWSLACGGTVKEEVILSKIDSAFGEAISVKLLTYSDGSMDLFRPQGNQFKDHLDEAKAILRERGMHTGEVELMLPVGGYLPVWKKLPAAAEACIPTRVDPRVLALSPFQGYDALVALPEADTHVERAAGLRMVY